tara:strand:+ start:2513 stop:3655 length:1143 start_codon:yes stop_codon:yes gene_type:complete
MATRSRLETVFTGDDRPFNRVASRMRGTVTKLKGAFRGMGAAMAVLGGGAAVRGTLQKADRMGKLADRWGVGVEVLQRLGHVAELGGSNLETVAKSMATLNKATALARDGMVSYEREFTALGLSADEMHKLNHEQRWFAISDAIKNAEDRSRAMAASQVLLGRGGVELFATMEMGGKAQKRLMDEIKPATEETIRSIERLNDTLTTLKFGAFEKIAAVISGIVKAFQFIGRRIGAELAVLIAKISDIVKMAPSLFPKSVQTWAKGQASAAETMAAAKKEIARLEAEDAAKEKAEKKPPIDPDLAIPGAAESPKLKEAIKQAQTNLFDPRRQGGFFAQALGGGTPISRHATKSLEQKMKDLAQKTFNENQTTNQLLRDALL